MIKRLEVLIGNEHSYPVRHRILNIVLLFGIFISIVSTLFNIWIGLDELLIAVTIAATVLSAVLYYVSFRQKKYGTSAVLFFIGCIFFTTPALWFFNAGISGPTTLFAILFSSVITALLHGTRRIITLAVLIIITLGLMLLEYMHPGLVIAYQSSFERFSDISAGFIITLFANTAFIAIILDYYTMEQQKSQEYFVQIQKQQREIALQRDLKVSNEMLQREINERIQMEYELRESERRFATAFQASPLPMCVVAADDGIFIDVNMSFLQVFGFGYEEIIGKSVSQLKLGEQCETELVALLRKQQPVYNLKLTFQTNNNDKERTGLFSVERIEINGNACFLCTINDITEHIRLEKEMARLDHLNLIGEMAASLGHEVRNPLTTVRGFLQMFQRKPEYSGLSEYFSLMIEELDRANLIIKEFLSLAKNKKIELAPNNLNSIITKLYPLLQADAVGAGKNITLELGEIADAMLDENEIRQCILNFVRNGLEATGHQGVVVIQTAMEQEDVVLRITDNGKGIPPEVLQKFGTPFLTTKENGTGLGIPICYQIAERHNAAITVKTGSSGTTFQVTFKSV